jgi:DNA repair protein RecN (Recombination protein N)
VDELPRIITELVAKQTDKNTDSTKLNEIKKREAEAKNKYLNSARELTIGRRNAALALDKAVGVELKAIEMSGSSFITELLVKKEDNWGEEGADDISFLVSTNSGIPPRPLTKIVSGGEMARLMLAIKVVLAESDPISAIVFDEVDSGVGGAVASAVGERLLRLASKAQVLVVTHSPQVAAKGKQHMLVSKLPINSEQDSGAQKLTSISVLNKSERAEEIARMLSGKEITDEARAAASSLLLSSV